MAEKGIYSPEEQRILDLFHAVAARIGAGEDNRELTVTEYSMLVNARWADVWNPLWNDAEYARKTRWGSLVAFPGYAECVGFSQLYLTCPEGKYLYKRIIGEDWQFYRPIRAGDVLSARHRAPTIEDITGEDGVRRFR